jgi:hypothetical protein
VPGSVYVEWRLGVDMVEGRNEVLVHWPLPLLLKQDSFELVGPHPCIEKAVYRLQRAMGRMSTIPRYQSTGTRIAELASKIRQHRK